MFFKTDTHWNSFGTYTGYRTILRRLSAAFPRLSPTPLSDFVLKPVKRKGLGLAAMIASIQKFFDSGTHGRYKFPVIKFASGRLKVET